MWHPGEERTSSGRRASAEHSEMKQIKLRTGQRFRLREIAVGKRGWYIGGDREIAIPVVDLEAFVNTLLLVAADLSCIHVLCRMLQARGSQCRPTDR